MSDHDVGPLACRYWVDSDVVQMSVFPTPVELMGGANDGQLVDPDFRLDLGQLAKAFESVADFGWCTQGPTEEGPYIWVEGVFISQAVYVQVLAHASGDVEPGLKLDMVSKPRPEG